MENKEDDDDEFYYSESPEYLTPSSESLPPLPSPEQISKEKEEEKPKRRHRSTWERPPAKIYADNFGFTVNSYQPMIEYLDIKDSGGKVERGEVHLPMLEERCLRQYSSTKPFKWYTNNDIDQYIAKGEKIRTQIRQNDAAGASNVLRRTHTNWSMARKHVQLVKNSCVVDHRKPSSDRACAKLSAPLYTPPRIEGPCWRKYILVPVSPEYRTYSMADIAKAHQIDHEATMAARRRRMRDIDNQFGQAINHMSASIDLMNRPVHHDDIPIEDATDVLMSNRSRRDEELDHMIEGVDNITNADSERNVLRRMYSNELARVQNDRLMRKPAASRVVYVEDPHTYDADYLGMRKAIPPVVINLDTPRRRRPKEDTLSDVQDRVFNRAREISGTTSEIRRINNRSKYLNVMGPRHTADIVPIGYTKVADNIDYMAKSLASKGKPLRRYEVDEEIADDLVLKAKTDMLRKTYSTDPVKPSESPERFPSNSVRVRDAQSRASARNTILYGY